MEDNFAEFILCCTGFLVLIIILCSDKEVEREYEYIDLLGNKGISNYCYGASYGTLKCSLGKESVVQVYQYKLVEKK